MLLRRDPIVPKEQLADIRRQKEIELTQRLAEMKREYDAWFTDAAARWQAQEEKSPN